MKGTIVAAIYAWLGATLLIIFSPTLTGDVLKSPINFLEAIPLISLCTAIVVFPTCILAAILILKFLPPSSLLWKPVGAATTGALAGPIALYCWASAFLGKPIPLNITDITDPNGLFFVGSAALAGAVFGFFLSKAQSKSAAIHSS